MTEDRKQTTDTAGPDHLSVRLATRISKRATRNT